MPELPEVEAVCRKLRKDAVGARVVRMSVERPNVTHPQDRHIVENTIAGSKLTAVDRRGKNILLRFSEVTLHVHLRMTGNLYVIPDVRLRTATTRAWFELEGGRGIVFDDPRNLGKMRILGSDSELENLGIEPLSPAFTPQYFAEAAARSRKPAKIFLMDQQAVAGLGNIYAAEALYRARIHPAKPMTTVRRPKLDALHSSIVAILSEAVESAVQAYSTPGRFEEAEAFTCDVYDREGQPCNRCDRRKIQRITQGGRSTYFCPGCQR